MHARWWGCAVVWIPCHKEIVDSKYAVYVVTILGEHIQTPPKALSVCVRVFVSVCVCVYDGMCIV